MFRQSIYYQKISERNFVHFILGLYPRVKQWIKYEMARKRALKRGAIIGTDSLISMNLARHANSNLIIGSNTSIGSDKLDTRSPVHIGNNVIISNDSEIITTSHCINSPEWEQKHYGIKIEDYVWIASNVLVLPSCRHIGYGSIIGAGAVVVKDVPSMCVMGGNPAVCIKKRECVHDKWLYHHY